MIAIVTNYWGFTSLFKKELAGYINREFNFSGINFEYIANQGWIRCHFPEIVNDDQAVFEVLPEFRGKWKVGYVLYVIVWKFDIPLNLMFFSKHSKISYIIRWFIQFTGVTAYYFSWSKGKFVFCNSSFDKWSLKCKLKLLVHWLTLPIPLPPLASIVKGWLNLNSWLIEGLLVTVRILLMWLCIDWLYILQRFSPLECLCRR